MVDQHKEDHQEADQEGDLPCDAPHFGGVVGSDFEVDALGFEGEVVGLVLQGEVEVDLLSNLLLHLQQGYELVTLGAPLDPEHYVVTGVAGELVEDGVVGEVHVLQTNLLAVVGADFDGPDQPLEEGDELGDVIVTVTFGVGADPRHKLSRLHPILLLLDNDLVLVGEGDLVLLLAVGVDLLHDVEDRQDVDDFIAEQGLGLVGLLDEGLDGLLVELGEQGHLEVALGVVVGPVEVVEFCPGLEDGLEVLLDDHPEILALALPDELLDEDVVVALKVAEGQVDALLVYSLELVDGFVLGVLILGSDRELAVVDVLL